MRRSTSELLSRLTPVSAGDEPKERGMVLLCSGGVDSSTLAHAVLANGRPPSLLFVDYGQPAAEAERRAVSRLSDDLGVAARTAMVRAASIRAGEIPGRNAMLIGVAQMYVQQHGQIGIGIHAGTGYADCSPSFVRATQDMLDVQHDGRVELVAPFVGWHKSDVLKLGHSLGVDLARCHSCETANVPCGECRSCLDRKELHVG